MNFRGFGSASQHAATKHRLPVQGFHVLPPKENSVRTIALTDFKVRLPVILVL